jgi:hypothetical protein
MSDPRDWVWTKPCGDSACIEYEPTLDGDWVALRLSTRPDEILYPSKPEWDAFVTGLRSELAAENARLRQERDEARAQAANLRVVSDELLAELVKVRPVVEAAETLLWLKDGPRDDVYRKEKPNAWATLRTGVAAAAAWRAAQKAPTDHPPSNLSQDPGEDEGTASDGSEAQGGAEAVEAFMREEDELDAIYAKKIEAAADAVGLENLRHQIRFDGGLFEAPFWRCGCGETGRGDGTEHVAGAAVRAAAPHLRSAALLEAADEISCRDTDCNCNWWRDWLRERAGRIGGGV